MPAVLNGFILYPSLVFTPNTSMRIQIVYGTAWHVLKLSINASTPYAYSMTAFLAHRPRLRLILVDTRRSSCYTVTAREYSTV